MPSGKICKVNTDDECCNYIVGDKERLEKIAFGEMFLTPLNAVDYGLVSKDLAEKEVELSAEILDKLRKNVKSADQSEDYMRTGFEKETNNKQNKLSYLRVNSIEEGADWYRNEFPQLPDQICEIMARWNWGDLSQLTKKKVKNDKKKLAKGDTKTEVYYGLEAKKGEFLLEFN